MIGVATGADVHVLVRVGGGAAGRGAAAPLEDADVEDELSCCGECIC